MSVFWEEYGSKQDKSRRSAGEKQREWKDEEERKQLEERGTAQEGGRIVKSE